MQQSKSSINIRRIAMIIGFTFFMLFAYKASHEVSNPKIAAGLQRTQVADNNSQTLSAIATETPASTTAASTVRNPAVIRDNNSNNTVSILTSSNEASRSDESKKQPNSKDKVKGAKRSDVQRSDNSED